MILKYLIIASLFASSLMFLVWLTASIVRNAGIVDIAWAAGLGCSAVGYFALTPGVFSRKIMIAVMGIFWAFRLASHLAKRVIGLHPAEDARYAELRTLWKENINFKLFLFFEAQALLIVLLSVPFLLPMLNPSPGILAVEKLGFGVWLAGLLGESLADRQLRRFKADPDNHGKVCDRGLWSVSRHPNYFFEWIVWWGFCIFNLGSQGGWISFYCVALMFLFLYYLTGIPFSEKMSLKSKGEAYLKYQQTTSAFVPWFRKS